MRTILIVLAALALAGCVVVPADPGFAYGPGYAYPHHYYRSGPYYPRYHYWYQGP
jgi:hypothetical protein